MPGFSLPTTSCETAFIAKHGYSIIGNEIDNNLNKNINKEGVDVITTNYDWRKFGQKFGKDVFDYMILLGNSLCLLRDSESRKYVIKQFRNIIKSEGSLIIDQRNFDYIIKNKKDILNGMFRFSGKCMYCGNLVRGKPIAISNKCVRFGYEDSKSNKIIGYLDMHPFKQDEMIILHKSMGNISVTRYSDISDEYSEYADIYTCVCK